MTAAITQLFKPEWAEAAALSGECERVERGKKVNVCVCVCEGRRHVGRGVGFTRCTRRLFFFFFFTPVNWPLYAQGEN